MLPYIIRLKNKHTRTGGKHSTFIAHRFAPAVLCARAVVLHRCISQLWDEYGCLRLQFSLREINLHKLYITL